MPLDEGCANSVRIVDGREVALAVHEPVRLPRGVGIGTHHLATVVNAERLRKRGAWEVERQQGAVAQQTAVVNLGLVDVEPADLAFIVDSGCLSGGRSRNGEHREHCAILGVDVGVVVAGGVGVVARSLVPVVQPQKLVEGGPGKINRPEFIVDLEETVSDAGLVDVEAVGAAVVVDPDSLATLTQVWPGCRRS
jgi:hypothetical protein